MAEQTGSVILDAEGSAAPPRSNGELVFEAPWESRIFGITVALHDAGRFDWEEFRTLLIDEIEGWEREAVGHPEPRWSYYERWHRALERLLAKKDLCKAAELDQRTAERVFNMLAVFEESASDAKWRARAMTYIGEQVDTLRDLASPDNDLSMSTDKALQAAYTIREITKRPALKRLLATHRKTLEIIQRDLADRQADGPRAVFMREELNAALEALK